MGCGRGGGFIRPLSWDLKETSEKKKKEKGPSIQTDSHWDRHQGPDQLPSWY